MLKKGVLMVAVLLLVGVLAGCGGGSRGNEVMEFGGISWIVLDVREDRALLITEQVPEQRRYNADRSITWENSEIREWLNGDFYNSFSSEDRERIRAISVVNDDNPTYGTNGGNSTRDKIFLLSIDEANRYFADDFARMAVDADGAGSFWWLRSPGDFSITAAIVSDGGRIREWGNGVNNINTGVRPALWLNL